ncbi:hypothetical protein ABZ930_15305 [Streptomyces sp. NPDC046716]|uniref:hypothetical protein n=1 Tax=Streptomyces sp. NPDC046716 TaxID=3157093 RepID=UPI0033F70526
MLDPAGESAPVVGCLFVGDHPVDQGQQRAELGPDSAARSRRNGGAGSLVGQGAGGAAFMVPKVTAGSDNTT